MKNALLVLFVLLFISSCPLFDLEDNQNKKSNEPIYTPKIIWQTEIYYRSSWGYPFEEGGYGYYPEELQCSNDYYYCRLIKIDLSNGEIIWRTEDVLDLGGIPQVQKIGNHIYLPLQSKDIIMVYDDVNGSLVATVSIKSEPQSGLHGPFIHTAVFNNYIFWGNRDSNREYHGLLRFDTSFIDFTKAPETVQVIEPELVWQSHEQNNINTNIVVNDGIVYFLTSRHWFTGGTVKYSYLVSMDAETGSVLWVRNRDFGWGNRENSLLLKDDRLYVLDRNPSCYNVHTGEPFFEKKDDVYEYTDVSSGLKGIFWYENKLYYTTGMHSDTVRMEPTADPKRVKNIICIDGNTGNLVWGDLVPNGATIYTFPLVNNGKAYVVTDEGLRVYNAYTGALIGVDRTVNNLGRDHNLLYNNMVIYPNRVVMSEYPRKSILTAIKAD